MNFKIWKYSLSAHLKGGHLRDEIIIPMPYEAQLLDAAFIEREPFIWALHLVEHEKTLIDRSFRVIVTGEEMNLHYLWKYFRTLQSGADLQLVYHLFYYHG